jgi:hypothetical protein
MAHHEEFEMEQGTVNPAVKETDLEAPEEEDEMTKRSCSKNQFCIRVLIAVLVAYSVALTVALVWVSIAYGKASVEYFKVQKEAKCGRTTMISILNPGACVGGWPSFANASALEADPWGRYFQEVYGNVPSDNKSYPLCIGDLWMFYENILDRTQPRIPTSVGQCPTDCGMMQMQRYDQNNMFSPHGVTWSWHPLPFRAIPNSTYVEVIHQEDPFGDEHKGAWMFQAKGSGISFNVGKSLAFRGNFHNGHDDAMEYFEIDKQPCAGDWKRRNECLSITAAAQGWDSLQFIGHSDDWEWTGTDDNFCSNRGGIPPMNIEIVATRGQGTYACMAANGTANALGLKKGWDASGGDCICDNSKTHLNCEGAHS